MRSTFKYCFSICCSKCIHSPYCSVIQWNLSVLQEISGRTDGILKPCKDTHLLPNGDGYESGLWTKGSLVCENAVDETYEVKFPFRWCPEYEDIWQIWHDDRVLGHHVMNDRINPVLHISFGHNSELIPLNCSFTVWEAFFSLMLIMARSSTEWKKNYVYMCFNWDVQVLFDYVAYFFYAFQSSKSYRFQCQKHGSAVISSVNTRSQG